MAAAKKMKPAKVRIGSVGTNHIDITLDQVQVRELVLAIGERRPIYDKLFKTLMQAGQRPAAEAIAASIRILSDIESELLDGTRAEASVEITAEDAKAFDVEDEDDE
jgi:hypothetical protein